MNTYKRPEIEVIEFEVPDIITVSSTEQDISSTEHDNGYIDIGDFFNGK